MIHAVFCSTLLALAVPAVAQQGKSGKDKMPAEIRRLLDRSVALRKTMIRKLQQQKARIDKLTRRTRSANQKRTLRALSAKTAKKIAETKTIFPRPELDLKRLSNGDLGGVASAKVFQIVSKSRMMVTHPKDNAADTIVMVDGVSTTGVIDDKLVSLPGLMRVAGTTSYTTVLGAKKTVYVLKPFDGSLDRWKKQYTAEKAKP